MREVSTEAGAVENIATGYLDWFAAHGRRLLRNPTHHHHEGAESSAAALAIAVNGFRKLQDTLSSGCSRAINNASLQIIQQTLQDISRHHPDVVPNRSIEEDEAEDEDEDEDEGVGRVVHETQAHTQPGPETQAHLFGSSSNMVAIADICILLFSRSLQCMSGGFFATAQDGFRVGYSVPQSRYPEQSS